MGRLSRFFIRMRRTLLFTLAQSFFRRRILMHDIIAGRRSVRFFKKDPIAESDMKEILRAGQWAPSPKNRQPWKFIVVKGMSRDMMIRLMEKGIERSEAGEGVLPGDRGLIANARFTMECMKKAPVTVLVVNPTGRSVYEDWSAAEEKRGRCHRDPGLRRIVRILEKTNEGKNHGE